MKTGLVVEDSEVVRKVARRILEVLGFETTEAEDVQSALDICQGAMPDFILLDADLPLAGGVAFIRALRKLPKGKLPMVLCLMTDNNISHITEALEAGATDFLMKPIDREHVEAKLAEMGATATSQNAASA